MKPVERFTDRAGDYAAGRPSYPVAAIDGIFDGRPDAAALTVVDLGAGTGISSRLLAARGARVIAVEPNAGMREQGAKLAGVTWQGGTAEDTGLENASADVVAVFQAFHWFDHERALREMARILRADGRAVLVYNERDDSDPFTSAYSALVRRIAVDSADSAGRRNAGGILAFQTYQAWRAVRSLSVPNLQHLDAAALRARALSTSYVPNGGAAAVAFLQELDGLFDAFSADGVVTMRMTTTVVAADI